MATAAFDENVFINCPFDKDYAPVLQAILFCILYLGLKPRIATESFDSLTLRLPKIIGLIKASRYSIHDLSRCEATRPGEHFRLNMPFELGIDYGFRQFAAAKGRSKKILILEEQPYRYQAALSDISGCDIRYHEGDHLKAVRAVRNWLVSAAKTRRDGARKILDAYDDFQKWHYESQLAAGFSEADIQDYPTSELLAAMVEWFEAGRPIA